MSKFETGDQPCKKFTPDEEYEHLEYTHECPICFDVRVFCKNCYKDHHANGWESCKEKGLLLAEDIGETHNAIYNLDERKLP